MTLQGAFGKCAREASGTGEGVKQAATLSGDRLRQYQGPSVPLNLRKLKLVICQPKVDSERNQTVDGNATRRCNEFIEEREGNMP